MNEPEWLVMHVNFVSMHLNCCKEAINSSVLFKGGLLFKLLAGSSGSPVSNGWSYMDGPRTGPGTVRAVRVVHRICTVGSVRFVLCGRFRSVRFASVRF